MAWDQYNSEPQFGPKANVSSRLLLETKSQILYYIKASVMPFIEYFCYCGGLFGMWLSITGLLFQQFIQNALKFRFHYLNFFFNTFSDPSDRSLMA